MVEAWLDAVELEHVRVARSRFDLGRRRGPVSWREIGKALGMTGQAAQRRFRDRL
jgi:hypothetical protein